MSFSVVNFIIRLPHFDWQLFLFYAYVLIEIIIFFKSQSLKKGQISQHFVNIQDFLKMGKNTIRQTVPLIEIRVVEVSPSEAVSSG